MSARVRRWKVALLLIGAMLAIVLAGSFATAEPQRPCWYRPQQGPMSRMPMDHACVPVGIPEPPCSPIHWCD